MTAIEILNKLKEGANFELKLNDGRLSGHGAINMFPECIMDKLDDHSKYIWYHEVHYPKQREILESLPWIKVVNNPRDPKPEEYPVEDGEYITMLDCDEHAVWTNSFRDGHWLVYDRTHVKWWMPIPKLN